MITKLSPFEFHFSRGEKSKNRADLFSQQFDPRLRGTNPVERAVRGKAETRFAPFFFFFLLSSSPELRGCSRCNTGQPATSCLESNSRPAACLRSLLAARKQIGSYNSLPRNDYVFSCNVCNGDFKHEGGGGGGRRGEGNRTS